MLKNLLRGLILIWTQILLWPTVSVAQFNPQPSEITSKFFPDLVLDIHTPAFEKSEGYTNYQQMMGWLNETIAPHTNLVSMRFIGHSQKGKAIPMLVLTRNNGLAKTKVWLQGGLHGDEPAGTETMLYLIHQLLNDKSLIPLLDQLEIGIVPMANIDGYEKQERASANGIDLNRDQTSLKTPETIALKCAFTAFGPVVALDFHEYRPFRKDFTRFGAAGITSRYDAMFLYSGNLNVPAALRAYTATKFVAPAKAVLSAEGFCNHDYFTPQKYGGQVQFNLGSVHSRSSATSYALANTVSTLLEIRGVGIGRTSFKRRIKTSYLIALSYLQTAASDGANLAKITQMASQSTEPIVVLSDRKTYKDTVEVIDLSTNKATKLSVTLHDALQSKPTLVRDRPTAYIIGAAEQTAIRNLKVLGVKVDSLTTDQSLEVQGYKLGKLPEEAAITEDDEAMVKPSAANTLTYTKAFSKGTYVIYLNQPKANLATEILEPENPNGFVMMKVIMMRPDQELPIYRYMLPTILK